MFNITDTEMALAMRFNREIDATVSNAQAIVDSKNASIDSLRAALRTALAELEDEKALRHAAEMRLDRLNKLLDTPLH
jgi:ABC-type transporter Mla subunit MlaD